MFIFSSLIVEYDALHDFALGMTVLVRGIGFRKTHVFQIKRKTSMTVYKLTTTALLCCGT
jgi:hypothetical protein